jgi:hypothetical protein
MSDKYIGDFKKGQTIRVKFNTFSQALLPTAPSVTPTVAVYKDSATEITVTGITQPTVNFDSKDGLHELVIDTSDAVYEIGKDYDIVFTAGTVDGKDLTRTILRTFSIENRNIDANVTKIAGQTANASAAVTFPASVANETTVASRATQLSVDAIPTNPLLTTDTRLNNLNAPIGSIPTNPLLTTDSRLNYLNASIAAIPINPLLTTDARLNFLDASIATSTNSILSAITGINNLSAKSNLFGSAVLEAPETGSSVYEFTLVVNDDEGKLVNLDTSPTITATNATGIDRSVNLSSVTNPSVGRYRFTYTVASTHPRESLRIECSGTTSTEARYAIWAGAVVDFDQSTVLAQISSDLALKPTLVQIEASTVLAKEATLGTLPNTTRNLVMNSMPGAGWDDGSFADRWLISNDNQRTVAITGAHHIAADVHETQPDSIHPTSFESTVYDTISADLLGTVHTGYVTPGTVGKTLNDTNTSLSALLARVPVALAQLVTDLAIMLVGSGTSLVRWTVNALSLAPSGGAGGTVIATVAVPQLLEQTAFELQAIVVYRGCYWSFQVQDLGDLTPYSQIWFSLRKRQNDEESESELLIAKVGGLLIANKQPAIDPLLGSLTVSGENVTIQVHQDVTKFIEPTNNYNYDIKGLTVSGQTIMLHESDKFTVKRDVTRRTSNA